jgi:lipid II:glycine glycyltransferase (peptidoglycan interpeptide bridge formation enzyme)
VYVDAPHSDFVHALVDALRVRGVSYARLGDAAWGLPAPAGTAEGLVTVTTHLMMFDATADEEAALARMSAKTRAHLRKAQREGVRVDEVHDEHALEAFCRIGAETRERMRARDVAAAMPDGFYRAVFRDMVPRREAVLLLARAGETPLAGGLFFVSKERMTYYHGGSTRDRAVTAMHGPTAMFWHAMRLAHARGLRQFDLGAVTPTEDTGHPHYSVYQFKRGFGGEVEELHGAEIVLSPAKCRFQEHVVLPAWKRMYPWYLAMVGGRSAA